MADIPEGGDILPLPPGYPPAFLVWLATLSTIAIIGYWACKRISWILRRVVVLKNPANRLPTIIINPPSDDAGNSGPGA